MDTGLEPAVEAVEIVNAGGRSTTVLLCEHASAYMPPAYRQLGLSDAEAVDHIAWDIGAETVARRLSELIDAPLFLATHSRLLVDLNRPPHLAAAMPVLSESTVVPGNRDLSETERAFRIDRFFNPFHDAVAVHLDARANRGRATRLLSIHSYTRTFLGWRRHCDLGVLFERAEGWAHRLVHALRRPGDLVVAANEPYAVGPDCDYAIPVHGDARGLDAILLEICNDLIGEPADGRRMAERIATALAMSDREQGG